MKVKIEKFEVSHGPILALVAKPLEPVLKKSLVWRKVKCVCVRVCVCVCVCVWLLGEEPVTEYF